MRGAASIAENLLFDGALAPSLPGQLADAGRPAVRLVLRLGQLTRRPRLARKGAADVGARDHRRQELQHRPTGELGVGATHRLDGRGGAVAEQDPALGRVLGLELNAGGQLVADGRVEARALPVIAPQDGPDPYLRARSTSVRVAFWTLRSDSSAVASSMSATTGTNGSSPARAL